MGAEVKSMDIKKTHQASAAESSVTSKRKVQDFVADLKTEIQKVHWTSREELWVYTQIVVLFTFVFGMSIYMMDLLIQGALTALSFLVRLMAG